MQGARILSLALASLVGIAISAAGCGDDPADPGAFGTSGGPNKDGGSGEDTICLLNNCDVDRDCADCSDAKNTCFQKEHRCIACGPNAGNKTCKQGQYCTKYGDCAPIGVNCPEDGSGVPTITCKNNADCGACGPQYKVCDTAAGKCVGCLPDNTVNCQSTDLCKNNKCVPKCPKDCNKDADCSDCGLDGKPDAPRACNRHICSQCSPTKECPNGGRCDYDHGVCIKPCGLGRAGISNCKTNANCEGCQGTTTCDLPVNGGEGVCAAPVAGCSDIGIGGGKGIFVLPDPFGRITALCSNDADCANVSAELNVGKIIRDATGLGGVKDGSISYAMHACAAVTILKKSCGVCVPCKQDTDCTDIDIAKVAGDIFGPIGSIGSKLLLDKAFGPNDHKVHMYCQEVAGDYGICAPCPNMLSRCAVGGDVPPNGPCDHDVCTVGGPLGINCTDPCVAEVCAKDPYCCIKEWDEQCKIDVERYCKLTTCWPNSCAWREAGWYCFTDGTQSGYRCEGEEGKTQIAEGRSCGTGKCTTVGPGPKAHAKLCTTATEPGCDAANIGKPACVP
jgi:hypothetical protein